MDTIIGFLFYSIRAGTPLLFGTTGEILSEKSGCLNLGVEGMMAMGAIGGYLAGCAADSLLVGLLAAFFSAALGALIYAFITVTLQANQNVTGLALTTFGLGLTVFIGNTLKKGKTFPALADSPSLQSWSLDKGIPGLRDIPWVGKLLFSHNIFVYIAAAVAVLGWLYLRRSHAGLRTAAVGENPAAADACGVSVARKRYINIILGGGITGFGGFYLGLVINAGEWNEFWTNGIGWISVALVIFARWNPGRAVFGAFFFGLLMTLQAWKGNLAREFPVILGWLSAVPNEFYQMLPFLITAAVLLAASIRSKRGAQPAALGVNYYREER
ncbi:MAG: ABC transporter permease [Oscillospiraceae bacterium]|nr:ABC transporter permease [Oscillospiraceae bacterium]